MGPRAILSLMMMQHKQVVMPELLSIHKRSHSELLDNVQHTIILNKNSESSHIMISRYGLVSLWGWGRDDREWFWKQWQTFCGFLKVNQLTMCHSYTSWREVGIITPWLRSEYHLLDTVKADVMVWPSTVVHKAHCSHHGSKGRTHRVTWHKMMCKCRRGRDGCSATTSSPKPFHFLNASHSAHIWQDVPTTSNWLSLQEHTLAWGHSAIVHTSLFRDCVVGTLSVSILTEVHKNYIVNKTVVHCPIWTKCICHMWAKSQSNANQHIHVAASSTTVGCLGVFCQTWVLCQKMGIKTENDLTIMSPHSPYPLCLSKHATLQPSHTNYTSYEPRVLQCAWNEHLQCLWHKCIQTGSMTC